MSGSTDQKAKCRPISSPRGPTEQRFWFHVDKSGPGGCWIWKGSKDVLGYGRTKDGKTQRFAHRISWEIAHRRAIPEGMCVCHACDNPPCVNPDHLWLGTSAENTRDMVSKGRHLRGKRNGENNPRAILTDGAVRDIRASKLKPRELSVKYGVSESSIRDVMAMRRWAHVPAEAGKP